jgi:tetratricopeptide (TPR) repeat protein
MIHKKGTVLFLHVLFLFFFTAAKAEKQSVFYYSQPCIEAQKHIAALRLGKAKEILDEEKKLHPNNAAIGFLENHIDFYRIVTSLDFSLFKAMDVQKSARFTLAKNIPASSPYMLYMQSEMHLQFAFIKAMNEEYVSAMLEFRSAYQLATENQQKFPAFKPSAKTVGMFRALLGTTPKSYKWVLSIAGLKGNFDEGMAMLKSYLSSDIPSEFVLDKQSAVFYYVLFHLNYGDKDLAWSFCEANTRDHSENLMSCYLRGYVGSRTAKADEAINVLQFRPKSSEYEPFAGLDYYLALCKLNRQDTDADIIFKRFISHNKNKMLMREAYKRLSWFYLVNNDREKFLLYRSFAKRYGSGQNEEEKNITMEISRGIPHDAITLKARLLFDGGYYQKAEEVIKQCKPEQLATEYQKLEYHYRYARILHEENKFTKAAEYYSYVIKNSPENTPYHFAPFSCLYLGYIYQKTGFPQIAGNYFRSSFKYTKAEYMETIQVKAGKELEKMK